MAKKRKKPTKRYAVALIAALFLYPLGWVQAVDVPVCTPVEVEVVNPMMLDGELLIVEQYSCAEGGIGVSVNGRVYAYDEAPDDRCAGYWRDEAMLKDGQPTSESNWGEPDWRFVPSQYQGCPSPASADGVC